MSIEFGTAGLELNKFKLEVNSLAISRIFEPLAALYPPYIFFKLIYDIERGANAVGMSKPPLATEYPTPVTLRAQPYKA